MSVIYSQRTVYPLLACKVLESYNIQQDYLYQNISVTLWVYNTKKQTEALVDLGATMNFINKVVIENNNLEMHRLANPYYVINVDNTPNKTGQITEYV